VQSCMSHSSETWPVKKQNESVLQLVEMRMIRWMCGVTDRFSFTEMRDRPRTDDIITVVQQKSRFLREVKKFLNL